MAKPGRGGGRPPKPKGKKKEPATIRPDDVYEAEDSDPDELRHAARYDQVENYEYEMPSDFEDEDIDDEMAFTEEDKKLFGHMFDDQPPAGGEAGGGSDSDEDLLSSGESGDEDEDEEGAEEDGEEEEGGGAGAKRRRRERDEMDELFGEGGSSEEEEEEGGSEGLEEEEEEEEQGGEGSEEDEEAAAARHRAMLEAVTTGGGAAAERRKRRARDAVVTEAYPEAAYNLPPSTAGGELTVSDLIAGLGDGKGKLGAARKALERLEKKAAPVAAPLPGPIQQRQERKAGYEESKMEADKWLPIVKANREAPTLRFTADKAAVPRTTTTAAIAAKHRPETDMEAEVAALLEAAGAHSAKAVAEAEEALAMKALSLEEARERQNRLARMRALLFYHEAKARRLKKIKSKEYRRKLKKAEKRRAAEAGEAGEEEEELRLMQEHAEFDRAKERLTLKHKNTSRWARRALRRGQPVMDEGTKAALEEQLRLGQELRQRVNRMKGAKGSDSDASTSASDEEGGSGDEGAARGGGGGGGGGDTFAGPQAGRGMSGKVKAAALELLEGNAEGEAPSTGLFALPFMRRALERKKVEAQQAAEEALQELDGGSGGAALGGRGGRLAFTGTGVDQRQQWQRVARMEAAALNGGSDLGSDEDEDAEAKAQRLGKRLGQPQQQENGEEEEEEEQQQQQQQQGGGAAQPDWLFSSKQGEAALAAAAAVAPRQRQLAAGVSVGPASGTAAERQQNGAAPAVAAAGRQQGEGGGGEQAPAAFVRSKSFKGPRPGYAFKKGPQGVGYYLDGAEAQKASRAAQQRQKKQEAAARRQQRQQQGQQQLQEEAGSEDERNMQPVQGSGLSQAELVRRAFAGDDVAAEFSARKAEEIEGELPKEEVPGVLPGWGTWAGQQREPRWAAEAKRKAQARKEAAAAGRKDAKLEYVVISEKWDKKSSKYKTPSVPFPFDSKETYERAMRQPLGREYNTDVSFRNLTRPAVLKDAGVIIEPIRFSKHMAQHDEQVGKNAKRAAVTTVAGGMPKKSRRQ